MMTDLDPLAHWQYMGDNRCLGSSAEPYPSSCFLLHTASLTKAWPLREVRC